MRKPAQLPTGALIMALHFLVLYARAFERLSAIAVHGDEARARITDAIDAI